MAQTERFRDRVVVVTGASTGIGFSTARRFAAEGAQVVMFARHEGDLEAARTQVGSRALAVAGDVTSNDDLRRLFTEVEGRFGRVDVLFANAGVAEFQLAEDVTEALFDRMFDVNVRGAFFTVQGALGLLRPMSNVVLTTSIANAVGLARMTVYGATKAAVRSMARSLAVELAPRGVRVNAVSPGPTESAIHGKYAATMTPEALAEVGAAMASRNRAGRLATADEVSRVVAFVASDDAAFVTGQEITVDGGFTA